MAVFEILRLSAAGIANIEIFQQHYLYLSAVLNVVPCDFEASLHFLSLQNNGIRRFRIAFPPAKCEHVFSRFIMFFCNL